MYRIVIGGGMSGIVTALCSAHNGNKTTLIERNSRLGRKIAMSGNGRCNILNENPNVRCYNESNVVDLVYRNVNFDQCADFLRSVGIFTFADESGRVYPITESANSVVDCLRLALKEQGVEVLCDCTVKEVKSGKDGFTVVCGERTLKCDDVVIAVGSGSQAPLPNICGMEKYYTTLCPSLVPLKVANMDKSLNGIRVKSSVALLCDGKTVAEEQGELLFRDYGLSGICAFDLSAVIARRVVNGKQGNYAVQCDLVTHLSKEELEAEINERLRRQYSKETLLYGIVHNKIAEHVLKRVTSVSGNSVAETLKCCSFPVSLLADYGKSQVTAGGIDDRYVTDLKLPNGIGVVGEALNVDGKCGGYNLMFAIASALLYSRLYK